MTAQRPVTVGLGELEGLVERAHSAVARARALRARVGLTRNNAEKAYKSAAGSCVRSGGRAAALIHRLETASHDLQLLQSKIDSVMKRDVALASRLR